MIGRIRERLGQAGYALDTPPTEVDAFDREVPWYRSSAGSGPHQVVNHSTGFFKKNNHGFFYHALHKKKVKLEME